MCARCTELSDEGFLLLPGLELEYQNVLCFGIEPPGPWDECARPRRGVPRAGGRFLSLSHPRKLHPEAEDAAFPVVEGVEVWNCKYDGTRNARPASLELWERLRAKRPELVPLAGLDFHRTEDWADVVLELDAAAPTRTDVLAALRAGAVRIVAHGEVVPIYDDSDPAARRAYRRRSAAMTTALDAANAANAGLSKAGIPVPRSVKKFVKKLL